MFQVHTPSGKRKKWSAVVVMSNETIHLLDHKMAIVASYQGPSQFVPHSSGVPSFSAHSSSPGRWIGPNWFA